MLVHVVLLYCLGVVELGLGEVLAGQAAEHRGEEGLLHLVLVDHPDVAHHGDAHPLPEPEDVGFHPAPSFLELRGQGLLELRRADVLRLRDMVPASSLPRCAVACPWRCWSGR